MTIGKISAASPGAPDAPGNFQGGQALKPHGKSIAPSLETSQSSPAGGSASTAFVTGEENGRKEERATRRPPLPQPRGQYAHVREDGEKADPACKKGSQEEREETHAETFFDARREGSPGGLTAAGRKAFARSQGAHLRPGVTKKMSEVTPEEMRRKGSWAVRFYGRKELPPLLNGQGRPTRYALSAHAWGEPVPRTVTAARRIAAKGKGLLARYRRITKD
jgi:hypothetical protein